MIELSKKEKAYFHLPGLFEFYELYKKFLPLFYNHREYYYDWCEIGSQKMGSIFQERGV